MNDCGWKNEKANMNQTSGDKSNGKAEIICSQCEKPGHVQSRWPLTKVCPVCGSRGHTANQCGTNSNPLAILDSKSIRDEDRNIAKMITVAESLEHSMKADRVSSKAMSEMGSRLAGYTA